MGDQVWGRLKERCHSDGDIDFDHFLVAVRGAKADAMPKAKKVEEIAGQKAEEAPQAGLPIAARSKPAAGGLPISTRQHGAMAAMGLPVAKRGGGASAGLPIASRSSNASGSALPIASR